MNLLKISYKALVMCAVVLSLTVLDFSAGYTSASPAIPTGNAAQNKMLDFTMVNATGFDIKLLYIGPSNNPEWTADMEILKGKTFRTGTEMPIRFNPRTQASKWDIMVEWTDGSKSGQFLGLDLSNVKKLTILYDPNTDETSFRVN